MNIHKIKGGGGNTGSMSSRRVRPKRPPHFIHSWVSQCWLTWSRQMNSELAEEHRLVAMDHAGAWSLR